MSDNLHYTSTRDNKKKILSAEAIVKGIADDGGLYVSGHIPHVAVNRWTRST